MLRQHATLYRRVMITIDVAIAAASFFCAYYLNPFDRALYPLANYLWILPVHMIIWGFLPYFAGLYTSFRIKSLLEILSIILKTAIIGFLIFGAMTFVFKISNISRIFILTIFCMTLAFISFEKIFLIRLFRYFRRKGFNYRNLLIVGTGSRAQKFINAVDTHREFGLKVFGLVDDEGKEAKQEISGHQVVGFIKDIPQIIRENVIDIVVFIVPRTWLCRIEEAIVYCETVGVSVSVAVDLFDLKFSTGKEGHLFGFPFLTFERAEERVWYLLIKRTIDLILSGVALIILSPLMVVIAVLIKMTSEGPVFFRQKRCGLHGRSFSVLKFRTMEKDAEAKLGILLPHNEMAGPAFKMLKDPRVTTVGRILRKFSLDELPQLWNVLKGDMSLVGPRPPLPREVALYDHWQRRRLSMRPGITCLWQTSGRNNIKDFTRWANMDLEYIDRWSLLLDIKILLKTIPVVLSGIGAE